MNVAKQHEKWIPEFRIVNPKQKDEVLLDWTAWNCTPDSPDKDKNPDAYGDWLFQQNIFGALGRAGKSDVVSEYWLNAVKRDIPAYVLPMLDEAGFPADGLEIRVCVYHTNQHKVMKERTLPISWPTLKNTVLALRHDFFAGLEKAGIGLERFDSDKPETVKPISKNRAKAFGERLKAAQAANSKRKPVAKKK